MVIIYEVFFSNVPENNNQNDQLGHRYNTEVDQCAVTL